MCEAWILKDDSVPLKKSYFNFFFYTNIFFACSAPCCYIPGITSETDCYMFQFTFIFTRKLKCIPTITYEQYESLFWRRVFIFPLWATPLPPLCWLRATILSAPRGEANPWRSSETRVAPAPWPTCMAPLTWLPWLPIEGSTWTSRLTCYTVVDNN